MTQQSASVAYPARLPTTTALAVAVSVGATAVAIGVGAAAWRYGNQPVAFDAYGYYTLAVRLATLGPAGFDSDLRTYLYPGFLATLVLAVGRELGRVHAAAFVCQLAFFLAAAWIGARRFAGAFDAPAWAPWIYAATVVNPYLVMNAVQLLTDVPSATLVYLAVALSLPDRPVTDDGRPRAASPISTVLAPLLAGLLPMMRPSNVAVVGVLVLAWLYRTVGLRDLPWRRWPILVGLLVLAILPQLWLQYQVTGSLVPARPTSEYADAASVGTRYVKHATVVIPGLPAALRLENPLAPTENLQFGAFLAREPSRFLGTMALHGFALFDPSLPFVYANDLLPWYRWPVAVPGYLTVLAGFAGLLLGIARPPGRDPVRRANARFSLVLAGGVIAVMVATFLPSVIDVRYGMPNYPLLAAPAVLAVARLGRAARGRPGILAASGAGAVLWVGGLAAVSSWLDQQSPTLARYHAAVTAPPGRPSAALRVEAPERMQPEQRIVVPVTATNVGPDTWYAAEWYPVRVQVAFEVAEGARPNLPDASRAVLSLPSDVGPGDAARLTAALVTPPGEGRYVIRVTVIREGFGPAATDAAHPIAIQLPR